MTELDGLHTLCCRSPYKRVGRANYVCSNCNEDVSIELLLRVEQITEHMPKTHPETYYAPIAGVKRTTDKPHKFSAKYIIYDKNMRKLRGQSFKPFTHEVPYMGCVLAVAYNQKQNEIILFDNATRYPLLISEVRQGDLPKDDI